MEPGITPLTFKALIDSIAKYQIAMGFDPTTYSDERRMQVLRDYVVAFAAEQVEFLDEVSWKPWRSYESQKPKPNRRKLALEWVDMLFFLVNQGHTLELTSDELEQAFRTKLEANWQRIANGYSIRQNAENGESA